MTRPTPDDLPPAGETPLRMDDDATPTDRPAVTSPEPAPRGDTGTALVRWAAALFREPTPSGPRGGLPAMGRLLAGLAVAVAAAIAFTWRLPPGRWDKLWAEDGDVFLDAALRLPWWETPLRPYAGYPHLYPRLSAEVAAALPLDLAPYVFIVLAATSLGAVAWCTWRLSAGHLPSPVLRLVLVAALALVPGGGLEATGNVANSHFYLLIGSLWALLGRSRSPVVLLAANVVVAIAALTEPLSLLLLPIVVARAIALRGWRDLSVVVTWSISSAIELVVVLGQERTPGEMAGPGQVLFGYALRVVSTTFIGVDGSQELARDGGRGAVVAVGIAGVVVVLGAVLAAGSRWLTALAMVVLSFVCFLLPSLFALPGGTFPPSGAGELDLTVGGRYTIAPSLLLLTALLLGVQTVLERHRRAGVLAVLAVTTPVVVWALTDYRPAPALRTGAPDWSTSLDQLRRECREDPERSPASLQVEPGGSWTVEISCAQAAR